MLLASLAVVAACMAVSDFLGTVETWAVSRGKAGLAGDCDALGDVARIVYYAIGVDQVYRHGFLSVPALATIGTVCLTSKLVTTGTVKYVDPKSPDLPGPTEAQ